MNEWHSSVLKVFYTLHTHTHYTHLAHVCGIVLDFCALAKGSLGQMQSESWFGFYPISIVFYSV